MEDNKNKEKIDKFKLWMYIGFSILILLLLFIIIYILFFNKSNNDVIYRKPIYQQPITTSNTTSNYQNLTSSNIGISTNINNRSSYISSLFKRGGRKLYKRF
jgi:hypothetical protein